MKTTTRAIAPAPAPLTAREQALANALTAIWNAASDALDSPRIGPARAALADICETAADALADLPIELAVID